ncbi:MAG: transposase [Bacteroidales bacterium]
MIYSHKTTVININLSKRKNDTVLSILDICVPFFQKNYVRQKYYKKDICPYLSFGKSKNNAKVRCYQVVQAILYRLKTGCQWRHLPTRQFFQTKYSWESVYYHFKK